MAFDSSPSYCLSKLRPVLETAFDAVVVMRLNGEVADWNGQAEAVFGWRREEAVGRKLADLIVPPQYREAHSRGLQRYHMTGEGAVLNRRIEISGFHKHGYEFPVELSITQVKADGETLFLGFLRDISERKRAEAELRESEARMLALLDSMTDCFCAVDRRWRLKLLSHAAERFFGVSRETSIGQIFWDVFPGARGTIFEEQYRRVVETGATVEFESSSVARPDRYVMVRATPMPDGGMAIMFTDVTERRRAEAAVAEREAYISALFAQTTAGVAQTNVNGRFLLVNDRYCELLGRSREELLTLRMQDVTHPDDLVANIPLFQRAVETGEPFQIEKRYVRPDGSIVWVNNSVTRVQVCKNAPVTILAVGADITERKQAEELQRLLVNELHHRIKNSLTIVQSIANQTFKGAGIPADIKRAFEGRLAALAAANNTLAHGNWKSASMRRIVEDAVAPFASSPERFVVEGPDLPLPSKTAISLALTLHELGTNAAKYGALSSTGGRVQLRWQVDEGRLKLIWHESGGPPVLLPKEQGFGTRLIERSLAAELGGRVTITYPPDGAVCVIDAPLPADDDL